MSWLSTRFGPACPKLGLGVAVVVLALLFATDSMVRAAPPATAADAAAKNAHELAQFIDQQLAQHYASVGAVPAPPADDTEFLRRVYLDVTGTIPTAGEVREYLADTNSEKRAALIDSLVDSPAYVDNFTQFWLDLLIPEAKADQQLGFVSLEFSAWLRMRLSENTPYDEWVREILTVPLSTRGGGAYMFYSDRPVPLPTAYFAAKDVRPENLAASTARVFLGLRVDCAQCHDHPFADWKQEQFWAYAAFYQGLERSTTNPFAALADLFTQGASGTLSINIPDRDTTVEAAFLDGARPDVKRQRPRAVVAEWLASEANPYFARAAANRLWAHLFGIGLVDPVDDLDHFDAAVHAALLDGIAQRFVASNFDFKYLLRGMLNSRAYQLSRAVTHPSHLEPSHFARKTPRKLSPSQIFRSIQQARGAQFEDQFGNPYGAMFSPDRQQFIRLFDETAERPIEKSTAVLEALTLMNGPLVMRATEDTQAEFVRAIAQLPGTTAEDHVSMLYLATLSRPPADKELARLKHQLEINTTAEEQQALLCDLFWALLNCSEFVTN